MKRSGSRGTRADRGVRPTIYAAFADSSERRRLAGESACPTGGGRAHRAIVRIHVAIPGGRPFASRAFGRPPVHRLVQSHLPSSPPPRPPPSPASAHHL